ncbi:polyketide synthase PKS2 [Apiospora kogelbergensis]|uniref:Polyketide synthase PKS2 n=1 Tax=Apiospora kogelbergensis TaxID=1337665 RepID=A0AAW0R755_9PEZI
MSTLSDAELAAASPDDIAIIGLGCRFPGGATTPSKLWDLFVQGRSAWSPIPASKWNASAHYHPSSERGGSNWVKGGHFLEDGPENGKQFDAPFFNITRTEAMSLDLQQRIVLENVYEALENAGLRLDEVKGSRTSVYAGAFTDDSRAIMNEDPDVLLKFKPTGTSTSIISNRISYFYDLKGTSLTLDTACSSSLVAFALGCQDLRNGGCEMSIVTGVNIIESPETMYRMSNLGFLSPDGRCFSFDSRANGYSRGEGVGTVILKPVAAALRDGNTIRAIVRGTGIGQDGQGTGAMTLPNKVAQEALMREVYANYKLNLDETGLVEAHATGTAAGDPLEAGAIASTFRRVNAPGSAAKPPLYVGAGKTNHGHLEGASGVAAIIKTVLSLEQGIIPPNVNFEKCNPRIPIDKWGIKLPLQPTPFLGADGIRRASINSFGFGGTNAHAVLDDAASYLKRRALEGTHVTKSTPTSLSQPESVATKCDLLRPIVPHGHRVFMFSANDEGGIKRILSTYADHLEKQQGNLQNGDDDFYLSNLAYTLSQHRSHFSWRIAIPADSHASLLASLKDASISSRASRAQWFAMGRELLQYPAFQASVTQADAYLSSLGCDFSVMEELAHREAEASRIDEPLFSQTLCSVLQIALVNLLETWNVAPKRVVGHSSGEIAAAYAAGALNRESAWRVAYSRGLISSKPSPVKGAMLAVGYSAADFEPLIKEVNSSLGGEGELGIACYNSPKSLTISGDEDRIDALKQLVDAKKVFARKLRVGKAYHSSHMRPFMEEYTSLMGTLECGSSKDVQVFSSVTGQSIGAVEMSKPEYWTQNLVSPVKFQQAVYQLCTSNTTKRQLKFGGGAELPVTHLVEIGPHSALQGAIRDTVSADPNLKALKYLSVLTRNNHACLTALEAMSSLVSQGYPVQLLAVNRQDGSEKSTSQPPRLLVDLPPYPFNHSSSQEYWSESRRSKGWRFRKHPRHDLLGTAVPDWNREEPKWRNFLRVSELPWLKDHLVTGSIVVPGVSYLIMAIEGLRQLYDTEDEVLKGFNLRDISISRALQIQEEEDTEVMLSMKKLAESAQADSNIWWEWKVTSYSPHDNSWLEHCRGQIAAETGSSAHIATGPIDAGREALQREASYKSMLSEATSLCNHKSVEIHRQYADLERVGLVFGPLFRNLTSVQTADSNITGTTGQALGTLRVPDIEKSMPAQALSDHVIHPPVFDSLIHLFLFAFQASSTSGGKPLTEPMVPVAIRSVWVSADMQANVGSEFIVHSSARMASHKRFGADITAWSKDSEQNPVRLVLRGLEAIPLQESASGSADAREICFNLDWKPDVDLLEETCQSETFLRKAVEPLETKSAEDANLKRLYDLQLAAALFITDAVNELSQKPVGEDALPIHQKKYLAWLRRQADLFANNQLIHQDPSWKEMQSDPVARGRFLDTFETEGGPEGRLTARMGRNIVPVLRGQADSLHLMFGMDDLLEQYYRVILGTDKVHAVLGSYVDILSHKRGADLRVLEIGAGTGGTSTCVLESLCPTGSRSSGDARLLKYTYTDVSAGFFEKAGQKFAKWKNGGVLEFRVLDVEKDVEEQGFDEKSYDVIVAANVLHATKDLKNTLSNVRKLLAPGGKLLLQEITQPEFIAGPLCFGQLPGWWLAAESFRPWGPLLNNETWTQVLTENGFHQNVLALSDSLDEGLHAQSLIVATEPAAELQAVGAADQDEDDRVSRVFVVTRDTPDEHKFAEEVVASVKAIEKSLQDVTVVSFADLPQHKLKNTCCIVTLELFVPLLAVQLSADEFEVLRQLMTTAGGLLWLTSDQYENPDMALITGLMRSLRWERDLDGSDLVTLGLPSGATSISHIKTVYQHHWVSACLPADKHAEYLVSGTGLIQTSRLIEAPPVNDFIAQRTTVLAPKPQPLGFDTSRSLMLSTSAPGRLDRLHFVDWPAYQEPLPADQIEVEIKATGLNFRDVMVAMGEVAAATFGHEGAGVVTKVGSGVTDVQIGDRMLVLSALHGTFQTHTRIPREIAAKIPDDMAFEEAAGIPVIFSTAYHCLIEVARLKKGETVLIHAAAGGVGQAAIQIAHNMGATVFATISSLEKKELLMNEYGIPEEHIFSSRDLSFAAGVMRVTNGKGVDVILNSLAGEALRASFNCIATFGRFVEIGKRDIFANGKLDMFPFSRSVTFAACDLYTITKLDTPTTARILSKVLDMFAKGEVHAAKPQTTYTFGQIEEAFRLLQQGKHIGKVVLTAAADDVVKVVPKPPAATKLRPDATYLLPGGLGGLGRSIAKWMAEPQQGAKNILFFSRTGGDSDAARELLSELTNKGVRAKALKCDVSDEEQLVAALQEAEKEGFPKIAGVIQGAMQLKDSAFEFMPHASWEAALAPKCRGTWNLHKHVPADVDFFVMLSSICGIVGNRGQSNYAAGNTFQDALATYRRSRGMAASCLDLGNILSVGYIAENAETLNANPMFFFAHDGVREDEFLSFIEFHLDRARATNVGRGQVAVGLATSADFRSRGLPEPTFMKTPLFAQLRSAGNAASGAGAGEEGGVSVSNALKFADSLDAAAELVQDALVKRLSRVMTIPLEDIDAGKPIHAYGVDSLVAMEFRNYIGSDCGCEIAVLDIMGNKSIQVLSRDIANDSRLTRFTKEEKAEE